MSKVALIIIYNHHYEQNIEVIERIYEGKFSHIYHLMPFYTGERDNVIPVYESSHYFQGYVTQGLKSFYKKEFTHYFFVADDLILNPVINERNYSKHLKLNPNTCFVPEIISLHERKEFWPRISEAFNWSIHVPGIEAKKQLPSYDNALQIFKRNHLAIKPLRFNQLWEAPRSFLGGIEALRKDSNNLLRYIKDRFNPTPYHLSYPLVGSYSDLFVVSADAIKQFSHYCGVFSATNLFVELAIPTSLVLCAKELITEEELSLKGKALWTKEEIKELDKYDFSLNNLMSNFPSNNLYLHPIKLSKWKSH